MVSISTYKANNHVHPYTQSIKTNTTTYHSAAPDDDLGERQQCAGINYANQIQTLSSLPDNTSFKIKPLYGTRRFHELSNAHLVFNLTSKFYWKISASFFFAIGWNFFTNREVMTSTYPYKQFVFFFSVSCKGPDKQKCDDTLHVCDLSVCQWLEVGRWFSPGNQISSTKNNLPLRYNLNHVNMCAGFCLCFYDFLILFSDLFWHCGILCFPFYYLRLYN